MKKTASVFALALALVLPAVPALAAGDMQEVLDNQKKILEKLDEIKAELEVVKIRATLR